MKLSLSTRGFLFLIPIIVTVVIYGSALEFGWLSSIDSKTYDLAMRLRPGLTEPLDVIVVAIDQSSLDNVFPYPGFPLSRHLGLHAEVVRKLDSAGAKLIAFDILFDRLTDVSDSAISEFASSLAAANRVILAASIERRTETDATGQVVVAEEILCKPTSLILSNVRGMALIDMPTDADGAIRRCYYGKVFQGDTIHSIASLSEELSSANNFGKYQCRAYASAGGAVSQAYLDSVGCIVFGDALVQVLDDVDFWQTRWNDYKCVLAYTICHEIGHALGRTVHNNFYSDVANFVDTTGVMECPEYWNTNHTYDKFNYFVRILLAYDLDLFPRKKDAVNLRDVLGITTIDISS